MSVWDIYESRLGVRGSSKREAVKRQELKNIERHLPDNLSYTTCTIDGVEQTVAIINSDNLNEKKILSLPGEDIRHGGLVEWMDQHWLVVERDANTTLYTHAKLLQCNYLLKWVTEENEIHEQWCAVEDGTKYLTGELEDRQFIVTRGDSRIAVTIARNEYTGKLNRENRFIIDDPLSTMPLAYQLTKPLKLGMAYGEDGVYKFVLQEVTATADDNFELQIADYYKHFPKEDDDPDEESGDGTYHDDDVIDEPMPGDGDDAQAVGRKRWL